MALVTYNMKAKFYNMDFRKLRIKLIAAVCVLLCLFTGTAVAAANLVVTTVACDGQLQTVYSFTDDPEEIIAKTDFVVGEKDRIIISDDEMFKNVIAIAKEHKVKVYDGDKLIKKLKFTGTVGEAVEKAGLELKKGDELNYDESIGITEDITIRVNRGFKVKITADGKTATYYCAKGTVEQVLQKCGIYLGMDDEVSPKRGTEITKKTHIKIKRVRYEYETVKGVVQYETKVEYDGNKYEDQARVKTKGKNGKKTEEIRKVYVEGEYVKTEVVRTVITKKPVTKVVVRGTKVRPGGYIGGYVTGRRIFSELKPPFEIELDEKNRPIKYKKIITGKATAYCTGTTCSTGVRAMPGRVAVDAREIPYGTKMYIVSSDGKWHYGYCTASDTGGFIYNSNTVVDLYMHSYNDCMNFGRRNVDIYILEWG